MTSHAGAKAIVDGDNVRLHIYDRHLDEFVVLAPQAARTIGEQLIALADRITFRGGPRAGL